MIPFPTLRSPSVLAEWAEAEILFGQASSLSQSDLLTLVQDEPIEDEDHVGIDYHAELETLCNDVWFELRHRQFASGSQYPLAVQGAVLQRVVKGWRDTIAFAFLLLLGLRQWYSFPIPPQKTAKLFEDCVAVILKHYVGGEARRFGWPTDGKTVDFETRARNLATALVARFVSLDNVSPAVKDHGLDVVAWRVIPDDRPSNLVLLCQCAIGGDWHKKIVHVQSWQHVIQMVPYAMNAVAFAFVPDNTDLERARWLDASLRGGLLFDRLRLTRYIPAAFPTALAEELHNWLMERLQGLPQLAPTGAAEDSAGSSD